MWIEAREPITPALLRLLATMHDDGAEPLVARDAGLTEPESDRDEERPLHDLEILHADGAELTEREMAHVQGVIAAHAVAPIESSPSR